MLNTGFDSEGASTVLTTKKLGMSNSLGVVTMDSKVANKDDSTLKVKKNKRKSKHNAVKNLDVEKIEDIKDIMEQEPYMKKKVHNEKKEKKGEVNQPLTNCGEVEDVAESVDSGCIVDSTLDTADMTDWPQVEAVLLEENNFITNFLRWVPVVKPVNTPGETDNKEGKEEAAENLINKRFREDATGTNTEDLEELKEKYENTLLDMRKNKKKKLWDPATRRKEAKLNRKLSRLKKRRDKRITKFKKQNMCMEPKKEEYFSENVKQKKPIYDRNGKLVFSKFDFSKSSASSEKDSNLKGKDLKQLLSQVLKEKEKVKRIEQMGDKENASKVLEHKAWSVAMEKVEGGKFASNTGLIKKLIKKKEARKKTSRKNWEHRMELIEKKKAQKQNIRQRNIKARKEAKRGSKMKMKKKGHLVPGF